MDSTDRFARELAGRFPWFEDPLEPYLDDGDVGYAYVFLAVEVTPEIVAAYRAERAGASSIELDWRAVLNFIDTCLMGDDPDVVNVIKASFVLQLPNPGDLAYGIVDELPARLRATFSSVRPGG
ncbi:hypothetical protein GCM10027059_37410 [Myceligenerans halotolerans]